MKTFASLFSGGGGADCGAIAAGLKPIWGVEIEPKIAEVAAANIKHQSIVKSIDCVAINQLERPDVLWASPPCQAFSRARSKRLEARDDADIGLAIISYLSILKPSYFFLENVEGYRYSKVFFNLVDNLYKLGYWINWDVLNAADFGVPQTRRRLILRAVKLRQAQLPGGFVPELPQKERWIGWYKAIEDLIPDLQETEFAPWQLCRMPELKRTSIVDAHNTSREATIRGAKSPVHCLTVGGLNRPCTIPKAFLIDGQGNHDRTLTIRNSFAPAFTMLASSGKHRHRGWIKEGKVVAMSTRAIARFQSFPDSYQLPESNSLACRILGNAVPPLMAQKLISNILDAL